MTSHTPLLQIDAQNIDYYEGSRGWRARAERARGSSPRAHQPAHVCVCCVWRGQRLTNKHKQPVITFYQYRGNREGTSREPLENLSGASRESQEQPSDAWRHLVRKWPSARMQRQTSSATSCPFLLPLASSFGSEQRTCSRGEQRQPTCRYLSTRVLLCVPPRPARPGLAKEGTPTGRAGTEVVEGWGCTNLLISLMALLQAACQQSTGNKRMEETADEPGCCPNTANVSPSHWSLQR